jgi:hypothetical protein
MLLFRGLLLSGLLALFGCSSSDDEYREVVAAGDEQNPPARPSSPQDDEVGIVVIAEGTNLRIHYENATYESIAESSLLLRQWKGLKQCLQVDVPDAYISIEQTVTPPEGVTDVIQLSNQAFVASVLDRELDAYVQVVIDDFAHDQEDRGLFFRQIVGKYMWRYMGYSERTYDPTCVRTIVR